MNANILNTKTISNINKKTFFTQTSTLIFIFPFEQRPKKNYSIMNNVLVL